MTEHRCTVERRRVADALREALGAGWTVTPAENGDGTGRIDVDGPVRTTLYSYRDAEHGIGWVGRTAANFAAFLLGGQRDDR